MEGTGVLAQIENTRVFCIYGFGCDSNHFSIQHCTPHIFVKKFFAKILWKIV